MRPVRLASLLLCATLLQACGDDAPEPPAPEGSGEPEVRELWLLSAPPEGTQPSLLEGPQPSLTDALRRIDAVVRDEQAKGLLLRVGPLGGAWGRIADIRSALGRVREAGKPIHCHFDTTDNAGYSLMASSCDRISMTPAGDLNLVGVAAHLFYARSLLDKVGLRADLMQMGRYKGAAEPFTREGPSDEVRESMGALLDDLEASLVSSVADGRNLQPARVREIIDGGPYDGVRAREAGLVDDVGFDDEAREHAREAAGVRRVTHVELRERPEDVGLLDILAALGGEAPEASPEGDRVALVYLEGNIVDEEEAGMEGARSGPFVRAMRSFADDEEIKAVVLRIDSPGGSALASDRMWHAVRRCAKKKPVIVSVGDMAASGGFYVASAGTEILAHEDSIVGSIGVVGGKVVAQGLMENIGVNVEILSRGDHAGWTTPTRPFTDEEREVLERMLRSTYWRFIRRVATGREMERADVQAGAEGRILSGKRALELGLIDRHGGLWEALAEAREQGGLSEWAPVERWPRRRTVLDAIAETLGGAPPSDRSQTLLRQVLGDGPVADAALLLPTLLQRERVAVALPYVLRVQ